MPLFYRFALFHLLQRPLMGDLVLMYDNGWPNYVPGLFEHVVLYAGNGMIYEEPTFGGQCQYVSIWSKGMGNIRIRRILAD